MVAPVSLKLRIFACGGTIDKVYFDAKGQYEVGEPQIVTVLRDAHVVVEQEVQSIIKKDSLDMTEDDRQMVRNIVAGVPERNILITHGTDTMIQTAKVLSGIPEKTIVLTGSMEPARFRVSDAAFNIGGAIIAAQTLAPGVWIVMNGQVFDPLKAKKNLVENRFENL